MDVRVDQAGQDRLAAEVDDLRRRPAGLQDVLIGADPDQPVSLKSPDVYRPLFWAGLWGIPFGFLMKPLWRWLYLFGFLYFLAPVLALFTIFLPAGALEQGGVGFAAYLILVNVPFGIVTALVARAIIGKNP